MDYQYRNELKHSISYSDVVTLRHRLRAVMKPDEHAGPDGSYLVRSLYFDTPEDTALREKIDGVNIREKFRIRYYNGDTSFIHLEKKSKRNGYGNKQYAPLTHDEAQAIVDGNLDWMPASGRPLIIELYSKMKVLRLRPKTIVDYTREAFVFGAGNVRVTLDYDIRTGLSGTDFLNPNAVTIPAGDSSYLLEVKWDEFLPSAIRRAIWLPGRRSAAFSKYQTCRIYG